NLEIIHPKVSEYDLMSRTTVFRQKPNSYVKRLLFVLGYALGNLTRINLKVFLSALHVFRFGKKALDLSIFYEAQWFANKRDFDVIHVHFGVNAKRIAYLKYLGVLKSTPLVTTFHGYGLAPNQIKRNRKIYRHIFRFSDAITVNTPYLKDALSIMEVDGNKIHILPVGLDTQYFKSIGSSREGNELLFCGRLIPLKAPDTAIRIVGDLVRKGYEDIKLTIIGTGEMEGSLVDLAKDLGILDHVAFMGAQPQDIIKHRMEKASIFLLPGIKDPNTGRAEAQGLVIQEAQSMELPVVVSSVGGMKYGLLPDETGYVVEEGAIVGFVEKIELLLNSQELRKDMGRKGREFVVENYENDRLGLKLIEIYRNIMKDQ
ncbi:MAG: glycosyltransferase family 4 protein, partial [Flavobacteriaceae bacterium]|nr:glycosyltransferase family 4 protein [Flavobacteriaceae bacterium]